MSTSSAARTGRLPPTPGQTSDHSGPYVAPLCDPLRSVRHRRDERCTVRAVSWLTRAAQSARPVGVTTGEARMIVCRCIALFSALVLSIACDYNNPPAAPSSTPTPSPSPTVVRPTVIPGSTYLFSGQLSHPVAAYTSSSRYVLDDHGSFVLQYPSLPRDYAGTYRQDYGVLTFRFADDGRWEAIGTLTGDSLEVRYNGIMALSDFDDAVYRLSQP